MGTYRIIPILGGGGFKVHVTDAHGGLRVIGIFRSEAEAAGWISTDHGAHGANERTQREAAVPALA
jgi:hypothetical protein